MPDDPNQIPIAGRRSLVGVVNPDRRLSSGPRADHHPARDSMTLASRLSELLSDKRLNRKIGHIFVDAAFGGPDVNRLHQLGFTNVSEVNFGR